MRKLWPYLLAALLLCAAVGLAQGNKKKAEQTRSVKGAVTAADETPVNGAVVYLKNTKSLAVRSFITQKEGAYYFHELSPDVDYELRAEYSGASSSTHTLSSFDSRKDAVIDLKLKPKK
jgi:hypothetical protein